MNSNTMTTMHVNEIYTAADTIVSTLDNREWVQNRFRNLFRERVMRLPIEEQIAICKFPQSTHAHDIAKDVWLAVINADAEVRMHEAMNDADRSERVIAYGALAGLLVLAIIVVFSWWRWG